MNARRVFMVYAVNSVSLFYLSNYGNKFSGIHSSELKEIILPHIKNTVGTCKQIISIILYQVSSRRVALMYKQKYKLLFIVDQKLHGPLLYNYASQICTLILFAFL